MELNTLNISLQGQAKMGLSHSMHCILLYHEARRAHTSIQFFDLTSVLGDVKLDTVASQTPRRKNVSTWWLYGFDLWVC